MADPLIPVEVVYATLEKQRIVPLTVPSASTIKEAILLSGLSVQFPELKDINTLEGRVGIFGKKLPLDTVVSPHDRIEIYLPLVVDPKETRRRRIKKMKTPKT